MITCEDKLLALFPVERFNGWIKGGGLEVYVRVSRRFLGGAWFSSLEIASVNCSRRGRGRFTRFLECAEKINPGVVYVENVLTSRFQDFFRRRDYKEIPELTPSFYLLRRVP